jgi:Spy/CpxP family protein refolding chaperone
MNFKSGILIVLAGVLLMASASASAADRGPRHDRGHPGMGMGPEVMQHLVKAVHRLDLSEEQKTAIHADLSGLRETMQPLMLELHESRKALHEQITADTYDAHAVAEIAARQGSLTTEMTIIASEAASGVLAQLSDEQRAELKAMGTAHRAHRKDHMEMMEKRREGADSDTN